MSCGADTTANALMTSLLAGKDFELPDIDLSGPNFQIPVYNKDDIYDVERLTTDKLTTRTVNGDGVFDALMQSVAAHLKVEFEQNRITGAEYTKAYIGIVANALQTASTYLLSREQAYWGAVAAKMQARSSEVAIIQARVELEVSKVKLATVQIEAQNAEATFALTKLKLATEDQQYCLLKSQTITSDYQNTKILPAQWAGLNFDNDTKEYQLKTIMPVQKDLLKEQVEVQRGQTLDIRTDGSPITGSVGKQKDLYNQQIISYQRDGEMKALKPFIDAWITMKTIDEGLEPPGALTNASLNIMLKNIKKLNGLDDRPDDQYGTYNETRESVKGGNKPVVTTPDND